MDLFDILPSNYFSIFAGKNRAIYAESLVVLFELLQNDEALINKQDFLKALKDKNASFVEKFDYTEEEIDDLDDSDEMLVGSSDKAVAFGKHSKFSKNVKSKSRSRF